ncbi:hypothetical protein [Cellulomonas sp. NPDC089187]|uniref:hypothetical protein n=1 Tax=Cellulomonas sp. NPDC089187 TaxID=3154970 RepID=UPI003446BCFB
MSTRKRFSALIGAGVLAATLAACSGTPGAALVVDGQATSVAEVQTAYEQVGPIFSGATFGDFVTTLVQQSAYRTVTDDLGVAYSDQQLTELYQETAPSVPGLDPDTELTAASLDILRYSVVVTALKQATVEQQAAVQAAVQEELANSDIEVNPRYGQLDTTGTVTPAAYSWIVPTETDPAFVTQ